MLLQTILVNNTVSEPVSTIDLLMNGLLTIAVVILVLFIAVWILKKFLRRDVDFKVLLLTVPKIEGEQSEVQKILGQAENLFASLGSLKADRSLKGAFLGRADHLALEIVARPGDISFYAAVPNNYYDFFIQQIQSVNPHVHIQEVEDYNIFKSQSAITGTYLKGRRSFIFPLKTFKLFEFDPLETLVTALSKLEEGDSLAIQLILRSARPGWHDKGAKVINALNSGKPLNQALKETSTSGSVGSNIVGSIFSSLSQTSKNDTTTKMSEAPQTNTSVVKGIEEKISKAGFDVNIRVISSSVNKLRSENNLRNVVNAYGQYNLYEVGNSLKASQIHSRDRLVKDFIYRRYNESARVLLNSEELVSLWHLPGQTIDAPNIRWLEARKAAPPPQLPRQGVELGTANYRGHSSPVKIKDEDRRRHVYIIGQTGTGKSALLENMVVQDIEANKGVCLIDPHGDLVEAVLSKIPEGREEDVIVFDPSDVARPLGLNMLEFKTEDQKTFVINEMIKIFDKLYDLKNTGGPMFEQYLRNTILLMMEDVASGSTLLEVSKVLSDESFRRYKLSKTKNPVVKDFWLKEAHKAGGEAALQNMVPYITSKLTQFISNDIMRPIIAQQNSSFDFREVMDSQKILLVNLSKGKLGELNSNLLGLVVVGKLLLAALSRVDIPETERKDFYLYVDEFQNFVTDSIAVILSEARKYRLNLTIAHQYIAQLVKEGKTEVRDAVFGNVGTKLAFKVGPDDAEFLAKEFAPVFNEYDLVNIPKFNAYVKLLIDNQNPPSFNLETQQPEAGDTNKIAKIKEYSRQKYGRARAEIEEEISSRTKIENK